MKQAIAIALLLVTTSAGAQDAKPAPAAATASFTIDTPIDVIAADPKAKAALDAAFPGMTAHPMYDQFKSMSVKQLQPMASDQITDAGIARLTAELAALK